MNWINTEQRYGKLSIGLHWLMLIVLVIVYACMELHGYFPKGSAVRDGMKTWHYMLGLAVLVLVTFRLFTRSLGPPPGITPKPPAWQQHLARAIHIALYVFMFGMPILGWLTLSAAGKSIPFFGLELPALIGLDKALVRQIKDIHEIGSRVGYCLIGLHASAGLVHHYVVRDNTLERMLPWRLGGRRGF